MQPHVVLLHHFPFNKSDVYVNQCSNVAIYIIFFFFPLFLLIILICKSFTKTATLLHYMYINILLSDFYIYVATFISTTLTLHCYIIC